MPHLDSIDAVTSIEELNALLASDDFPFSPFVVSLVATNDIRKDFVVGVLPNLLFADPVLMGGTHYQDTDNPET